MIKSILTVVSLSALLALPAQAEDYKIDPAHSFVEFKIQHLGYSWLHGRFDKIKGKLSYDEGKPDDSSIELHIDPSSINTNHAERDKHLRSKDFLNVKKFSKAGFKSTSFTANDEGGTLKGELTLHGVTKEITIDVTKIGEGDDPWGGYRVGFAGTTTLVRSDFDMGYKLGPASSTMELVLGIEGKRKK